MIRPFCWLSRVMEWLMTGPLFVRDCVGFAGALWLLAAQRPGGSDVVGLVATDESFAELSIESQEANEPAEPVIEQAEAVDVPFVVEGGTNGMLGESMRLR